MGCIGDDFTGSSDLANTLTRAGMRTVQYCRVPAGPADPAVEAGIVALKTRTTPVGEAVERARAALEWLRAQGCRQFLFKYCSTFDSTPRGNIGPVADALADALDASRVIVCPAYPSLGRSVYAGHLFVGDRLLSESGMEHHPLTPMTDPDLRRWLAHQSRSTVGHISTATVLEGSASIRAALDGQHKTGARLIVIDTVRDADLVEIGAAVSGLPLVTGGSGIGLGLAASFRRQGALAGSQASWRGQKGPCAAISGSCSATTRSQVAEHCKSHPSLEVTAGMVMSNTLQPDHAANWAWSHRDRIPLIYSSADPAGVSAAQDRYGKEVVATAIECVLAQTARLLVERGFTRIVCAGGETSGAIVETLDVDALEIGPEIDPGVPALKVVGCELALALKSGNFGRSAFFSHAADVLEGS